MSEFPKREAILEAGHEDLAFLAEDFYDACIIGVSECGCVTYDAMAIVLALEAQGMTREEAHEYADFNIFGAFIGGQTPIYVWIYPTEDELDQLAAETD